MPRKVEPLPEKSLNSGQAAEVAAKLAEVHGKLAEFQTEEKNLKEQLAALIDTDRRAELNRNNYVGLYRITPEGVAPTRVEFRLESRGKVDKRAIAVDQEQLLTNMFGANKAVLFEKCCAISEVTDPVKVIQDLVAKGLSPNSVLEITIKEGHEKTVSEATDAVVAHQAFLPRRGFLSTLNDIKAQIIDQTRNWINQYLNATLSKKVCPGTKGAAEE